MFLMLRFKSFLCILCAVGFSPVMCFFCSVTGPRAVEAAREYT